MLGTTLILVLAALAFVAVPVDASTSTSTRVSPGNATATGTYLKAINSFEETELANLPQFVAATQAAAAQISGECPGVLTNAPPVGEALGPALIGSESKTPPSARARGESQRQSRQRESLKLELYVALSAGSRIQAYREAAETLVRALTPLHWTSPEIMLLLHLNVSEIQGELEAPRPAVCADMKFWVTSGYRTLSAASKEFAGRSETLLKDTLEILGLSEQSHVLPFPKDLVSYENASDKALARHTEALTARLKKGTDAEADALKRIEAALGLAAGKAPKVLQLPRRKPVVIARGRTAAGEMFVAKAEPVGRSLRRRICAVNVTITEPSRPQEGLIELLESGGGTDRCLSRSHVDPDPAVHCSSGLLTVEANLPADVRSVRLLLSDGRTITSPAIRVSSRLGGPAGLYYQAVRGPSPIPVSATELDAQGSTLAVLKLPAVVECTKNLVKYVPGGIVHLVHESVPQGPDFTIRGERYRKLGTSHFELKLEIANETLFGGGNDAGLLGSRVEEGFSSAAGKRALSPYASSGCQPQPYAIIYGLLKAPGDTVLAQVGTKLVPLREVPIPRRLHAGGVLVYGEFSSIPSELLIRSPSGTAIASKDLSEAAISGTETCEGEAEGS